eukprot:1160843-Pelagomonas_calceolata.AAC.4
MEHTIGHAPQTHDPRPAHTTQQQAGGSTQRPTTQCADRHPARAPPALPSAASVSPPPSPVLQWPAGSLLQAALRGFGPACACPLRPQAQHRGLAQHIGWVRQAQHSRTLSTDGSGRPSTHIGPDRPLGKRDGSNRPSTHNGFGRLSTLDGKGRPST